jgi:hypothetical protein
LLCYSRKKEGKKGGRELNKEMRIQEYTFQGPKSILVGGISDFYKAICHVSYASYFFFISLPPSSLFISKSTQNLVRPTLEFIFPSLINNMILIRQVTLCVFSFVKMNSAIFIYAFTELLTD